MIRYVRFLLLTISLIGAMHLSAMRVDSFSLVSTQVNLKIRNFSAKFISGSVTQRLVLKVSTNTLRFDLKSMTVDSIILSSSKLTFSQSGESVNVNLPAVHAPGDTLSLRIFYQGLPAADPSGWGGFYFNGDNAFNLGVGFQVYPHSFGRAWMPCVDEFPMKSSYEFYIETDTDFVAACNGLLIDLESFPTHKVWHYLEPVPMSAYLASVAVSKYKVNESVFNGLEGPFPVQIFHEQSDSLNTRNSFVNLHKAIQFFEESFGPQPYSKVGYSLVPFSGGAMEHAGNIAYPQPFVNGSTNYETLIAHELSHHWWGDLVTCEDAGDMWLNEGWASYCEHLFTERMYGRQTYDASIMENHLYVLRYAHIADGQIYSLTDIPETITYGQHVYKKGADVVHALRGVLGDSLFFDLCKSYLNTYRLSNASSMDMRDLFRDSGGGLVAHQFFNHFVLDKGFPHVIISKQVHSGSGPFRLKVFTTQKPRFKTSPYQSLPVEIRFYKDRNHFVDKTIVVNNELDSFEFDLDFKPVYVGLDCRALLSDAITDDFVNLSSVGTVDVPLAFCSLKVNKVVDTSMLRVEHHWVGPEKFVTTYPRMSNYRYISLDGIWHDSLDMDVELTYDGRMGGANSGLGYLDHTLIFKTEDSLTVLYRAFPGDYWREWNDIERLTGNKNDKQGKIIIRHAKKGDYVLAMRDYSLKLGQEYGNGKLKLYPNPSFNHFKMTRPEASANQAMEVNVYDANGRCVYSGSWSPSMIELEINTSQWSNGQYTVQVSGMDFYENLQFVLLK